MPATKLHRPGQESDCHFRLRRELFRPGDVLLTSRIGGKSSAPMNYDCSRKVSHAMLYLCGSTIAESFSTGSIATHLGGIEFEEWRGLLIPFFLKRPRAGLAMVYRNAGFLQSLRNQVLEEVAQKKLPAVYSATPMWRGREIEGITHEEAFHWNVDDVVDTLARKAVIDAARPLLSTSAPRIAEVILELTSPSSTPASFFSSLGETALQRSYAKLMLSRFKSIRAAFAKPGEEGLREPGEFSSSLIFKIYESLGFPINHPSPIFPPDLLERNQDFEWVGYAVLQAACLPGLEPGSGQTEEKKREVSLIPEEAPITIFSPEEAKKLRKADDAFLDSYAFFGDLVKYAPGHVRDGYIRTRSAEQEERDRMLEQLILGLRQSAAERASRGNKS